MSLKPRLKRWKRLALSALWPAPEVVDPAEAAAAAQAEALWTALFAPFDPVAVDADVLDLGCGDGRLARHILRHGRPRSVTGVAARARWDGEDGGLAWRWRDWAPRLNLMAGSGQMDQIEPQSLDLVLCRDLEKAFALSDLEIGLGRLYEGLRPGGEMLARAPCASTSGAGYGFMTPSAWIHLCQRAGFEILDTRRAWRDAAEQDRLKSVLAWTSENEALTGEILLRLARPWETAELAALTRRKKKRR